MFRQSFFQIIFYKWILTNLIFQKKKKEAKPKDKKVEEKKVEETTSGLKKQTRLGLEFKKDENLSDWYSQVFWDGLIHVYFIIK